jgi:hypothetical protein
MLVRPARGIDRADPPDAEATPVLPGVRALPPGVWTWLPIAGRRP